MIPIKEKFEKHTTKFVASFVTLVVIALLIFAAPAQAFTASLGDFTDSNPSSGDLISSTFDLDMVSMERVDVNYIDLLMNGVSACQFDVDGNALTACEGISADLLASSTAEYGYGYAYGYGYGLDASSSKLSYNITINTSVFDSNDYEVSLVVYSNNLGNELSESKNITISSYGEAEAVYNVDITGNTTLGGSSEGIELILDLDSVVAGNIVIEEYAERPEGTSFMTPLGTYVVITADSVVENALTGATELRVYYNDSDVVAAGLVESTMRLYFWNSTSSLWEAPLESGVNTTANYVWARTNHFSSWGVFGSTPVVSTSSGIGGGGYCTTDWSCTEWTSCENGVQTRTCSYPENFCAPEYDKPIESTSCVTNDMEDFSGDDANEGRGFFNLLTGFVVGDLLENPTNMAILIAVLVVIALLFWIVSKKKKAAVKKSAKKEAKKKK